MRQVYPKIPEFHTLFRRLPTQIDPLYALGPISHITSLHSPRKNTHDRSRGCDYRVIQDAKVLRAALCEDAQERADIEEVERAVVVEIRHRVHRAKRGQEA